MLRPAQKRDGPEGDKALRRENQALRRRLAEAEQTLHAIRSGAVDAIVVTGPEGEQVFTLQGAERPYRTVIEAMHAGAVTLGLDGTIFYANARFAEMLGLRLERLVGSPFERLVAPDDLSAFGKLLRESRSGSSGEISLRGDGDATLPVHLALGFLDVADVQAVCIVVTDLTEHKRMEEARRDAEQRYRDLFERSPVGVFRGLLELSSRHGRRFDVNDAYVRLFGYTSRQAAVEDAAARIFLPGEWDRCIGDLVKNWVLTGYEIQLQRVDGTPIWALMNATLTDQGDGTALAEGTILDITERKQAEDALRRLPKVLEQKIEERTLELRQAVLRLEEEMAERKRAEEGVEAVNRELKEFAYVVSHDLKAPLRAITSLAGWLRKDYADKLGEEGASQLSLLEGRARRLNALIDGVLEYSRVGRATEKKSLVDLDQLAAEVIDLLSPPASVHIQVIGVLPTVAAARIPLQQVFQNLLQNAIKFGDKPELQIQIACAPIQGFWEIIVTDNGPGIAERHFEKIFQMFRTPAPRDKVESTGIGLALAKKIVELHGGRIWVTSREGEGSSFHFTLPRDES